MVMTVQVMLLCGSMIVYSLLSVLQYAELKPVPCLTYSDAQKLREACATPILKQVLQSNHSSSLTQACHLEELVILNINIRKMTL